MYAVDHCGTWEIQACSIDTKLASVLHVADLHNSTLAGGFESLCSSFMQTPCLIAATLADSQSSVVHQDFKSSVVVFVCLFMRSLWISLVVLERSC